MKSARQQKILELIEKYDIDTILVGGLSFAWSGSDQYMLKFSEDFGK